MRWLHALGHALAISGSMTWEILWALILGFALSAVVQAVVRRTTIIRRLGDDRPKTLALAAGFGAASSSCSYAAVALARSLFRQGASFTAAMAFEIASTNLVVELGVILALLLGWQFTAAEFIGGAWHGLQRLSCSEPVGVRRGRRDAAGLMRRSVDLARAARAEMAGDGRARWVAASAGPYGAVLADGSEYRGRYGLSVRELAAWHRPRLEALAGPGVVFTGRVSEQEKHRLLCAAWLLVHPALIEGWGIVVAEAAIRGTPAVGFDVPGLRDSVVSGQTGLLVGSEGDFASAWASLALNHEAREAMGAAARERAARFNLADYVERIERLITA